MQEVWSVDSIASNSMKSNNPHSGFHKSKVIKTLDTSVPDPSKNQGGHIVMETMEEKVSVIEMGALVRGQGNRVWDDNCPTLRAEMGDNQPCVMIEEPLAFMGGQGAKAGGLGIGKASPTLKSADSGSNRVPCVLMDQGGGVMNVEYNKTGTLRRETHGHEPIIHHNTVVRRLTPVEYERLQGFPDGYTNIPWKNTKRKNEKFDQNTGELVDYEVEVERTPNSPDSRRYKALGNSFAVPVVRWIGKRIEAAEPIECDERAIERALYVTPGDDEEQLSLF